MTHPYLDVADDQLWPKAMTLPAPGHIDPARPQAVRITRSDRIVTMGSCFAQHLAKRIQRGGFNYLTTEAPPPGTPAEAAARRNYGLFSARYGNVYTARQAVQLFDRAFGHFTPQDTVWSRGERFVDPFRPSIEPEGHDSPEAVLADAAQHLACVREAFLQLDWLVLTLGLTETWYARTDGAVYPVAPGVAGGAFDPAQHALANFSAFEVGADIAALRDRLHAVNPGARIILTVSPVPLAATASDCHVWVATSYSKAVLRVAADEAARRFDNVAYFPSYEIITSPAASGRYFADDLRSVTEAGVNHVMRVFFRHFCDSAPHAPSVAASSAEAMAAGLAQDMEILCDEALILSATQTEAKAVPQPTSTAAAPTCPPSSAAVLFDEHRYLQLHPDVASAVAAGHFLSGAQHYEMYGQKEGRRIK
ncbi:MAG: GSCFA domain-containing protein [Proteobacteria bacterium]|nr:GSCFA domain-containing protein [Pseudomonadota bacterium]